MAPRIRLGMEVPRGTPLDVDVSIFERHTWITGQSGKSKSLQTTALALQLLRAEPEACFVFADFSGDQYSFHRIRELALERRSEVALESRPEVALESCRFRFLSTAAEDDWHSFNPMQSITPVTADNIARAASFYVSSLSLDHGGGYGKHFYSLQNYVVFNGVFEEFVAEGNQFPTLSDLVKRVAEKGKGIRRELLESQLALEAILPYPQLQPDISPERRIDVARAVDQGECIYGFLPTLLEPAASMIGAMFVWSFVLEGMRRTAAGLPKKAIYIFVDEFATVAAAKAFSDLAVLARKYGVRLVLVNQDVTQVVSRDRDLRPILYTNTALKLWLSPVGENFEYLQGMSPDVVKPRGSSTSFKDFKSSMSFGDVWEPELERNDGLHAAFERFEGYAVINEFSGFRPPARYRFVPDVTADKHAELANTPLPKRDSPFSPTLPRGAVAQDTDYGQRQRKLDELMAAKKRQEDWKTLP